MAVYKIKIKIKKIKPESFIFFIKFRESYRPADLSRSDVHGKNPGCNIFDKFAAIA